jgi:hypothetical protein
MFAMALRRVNWELPCRRPYFFVIARTDLG